MSVGSAKGEPLPAHCVTRWSMRVRFFETDLMGIVHHAAYLTYVEAGRVEYLRARGADYRKLAESGYHMPVVEASLVYKKPARFDDELVVETTLAVLTRVTTRFDYRILRGDELLVTASTLLACIDATHRPRRIPPAVAAMLCVAETTATAG
ncbi:MAG TPA: thioesterase family protein [Polyangiaceae bacterium]|nr:thioesterase family protein [Polyangiaceae bacterium]